MGKGAGTTNVVWGFVVHDWRWHYGILIGISFTILRETAGTCLVLNSVSLITALLHAQDSARIAAAIALAVLIGWIYKKIPDLDCQRASRTRVVSKNVSLFRGDKGLSR